MSSRPATTPRTARRAGPARRLASALAVLLALGLAAPALAGAGSSDAGSLKLPEVLWSGQDVFSGQLSARVSMRKVKYSRVLSERALALPEPTLAWPGGAGGVSRVELAGINDGLSLAGFNEMRLDYLTADPDRGGCLGFVVSLEGADGSHQTFVSDPLETVDRLTPEWADGPGRDSVPVARADWVAKGPRYLLSRLLDRAPDPFWHTSQDGPSTFVQRRFRKDLMNVGAVDVVLTGGQDVQVNLVVSFDPGGKGRTVLDWYAIPKRTFDLGDGRRILRLYLGRYLRELSPGAKGAWLKEMALMFFRRNLADVTRDRPVEKVLFVPSGLPPELSPGGLPRNLPARAREVFTGRGELAANLQDLARPPYRDWKLSSLAVVWSPQDPDAPFSQTLESARLADVAPRRDVPAWLAATADRCQSFGASCDIEDPHGLVGQDPLWSLDVTPLSGLSAQRRDDDRRPPLYPQLADKLFASPGRVSFSMASDGLGVACEKGSLVLDPVDSLAPFAPLPGRRYSLWLELGRNRRNLSSVTAEAYGAGQSVTVAVKPGFPAVFPNLPPKVEGVRLKFAGSPDMSLTLRRVVLQSFDPAAPRQDLFTARYLFEESRRLTPIRQRDASVSIAPSGLVFSPSWLLLDLAVAPWTVRDTPPVLVLSVGDKKANLPLPAHRSHLAVYLPALFGPEGLGLSKGWPPMSLALEGGAPGSGLDCESAVLAGERLATWPQVFEGEELLAVAGSGRTLSKLEEASASDMASSACWLPMGQVDIPRQSPDGSAARVRFTRNPWLAVEALLVTKASGPKLESLGRQAAAAPHGGGGHARWPAGLAFLGALGLFWGLWRKGVARTGFIRLARWLTAMPSDAGQDGRPLPAWAWLLALMAVPLSGLVLGPGPFRLASMLGTLFAVPFWRAARPRAALIHPALAKSAPLHYFTGVLAAATCAAALRLAGAAPVAELLGLGGLWLFCAACASDSRFTATTPSSPDDHPREHP